MAKRSPLKALLTDEEAAARTVQQNTAADAVTLYSNNVGINVSPWDFRLRFGTVTEASRERIVLEYRADVYMSPQHAKIFSKVLQAKVGEYEATFGAIPDLDANVPNPSKAED
jgi:hypothetical protein